MYDGDIKRDNIKEISVARLTRRTRTYYMFAPVNLGERAGIDTIDLTAPEEPHPHLCRTRRQRNLFEPKYSNSNPEPKKSSREMSLSRFFRNFTRLTPVRDSPTDYRRCPKRNPYSVR